MRDYRDHLISIGASVRDALPMLDQLAKDAILFVIDDEQKLIGSLTDGDVRRGLIAGKSVEDSVEDYIQSNPRYIKKGDYDLDKIIALREGDFKIIPVVDQDNRIRNVINFRIHRSYLPIDAVIMAGGRGSRLRPLTDTTPKPLLQVGDKPILEHNLDRLRYFGIDDFWLSVRYLGEQIEAYFGNGTAKSAVIQYVWEDEPLGTMGAVANITDWHHDYILVTNSDLLTTLDYEDFFKDFLEKEAYMSVVTIPYDVKVPYAVMETSNHHVLSFKEKPTYTYYSNGGIYLMKREVLDFIPKGQPYNATDLMEQLIKEGKKLVSFPMRDYWLDIGRPEEYEKAQEDIKHLRW